jgi:hypothetical protein
MAKINQIRQVKGWLPAGEVFNIGKYMHHIVHARIGNFSGM